MLLQTTSKKLNFLMFQPGRTHFSKSKCIYSIFTKRMIQEIRTCQEDQTELKGRKD
jgi:hypothetical protein